MADTPETNPTAESSVTPPTISPSAPASSLSSAPTPAAEPVPFEIAVLPLQNTTLFPETMVPLAVGKRASVAAIESALATEEKLVACVSVRAEKSDEKNDEEPVRPSQLYTVGTLVMIKRMERVEDTLHLIMQGTERLRILEWLQEEPFLRARAKILPDPVV